MQIITPELFEMTYNELCNYYIKKYGNVKHDYFSTPECKSVQKKNSRTKEGLEIHHIDENKSPLLSTAIHAKDAPFEYQKADRLVYVNVLEHLLLHTKIYEETGKASGKGQGLRMLAIRINDYYASNCLLDGWNGDMAKIIIDNFEEYKKVLFYHLDNFLIFNKDKRKKLLQEIKFISCKSHNGVEKSLYKTLTDKYYELLPYELGDKVEHDLFGTGIIYFIKEIDDVNVVSVKFNQFGNKKILESYDKMHRIKKNKRRIPNDT